ncbi:MAG: MFS transporter, partial [Lentisphaeria bacterium]|nr:MFS transporter [Lentisphaeria bacterium]
GKRRSMGMAMLFLGCGVLLCSFASVYWMVVACVLLAGVGEGICEGLATPFVNDLHVNEPGSYVNIAHSFWSVGTVGAVVIVGLLHSLGVSWRGIVCFCGLASMLSSLGFLWRENPAAPYPEVPPERRDGVWKASKPIFASWRFWLYCFCMLIGAGAEFGLTFWSAAFIQLNFNTGVWPGILGTAALGAGMFTGRYAYGRFVPQDKLYHLLLCASFIGVPVSMGLMLIRPDSFASPILVLGVVYLLLYLAGLCVAPFWPSLQVYGVLRLPKLDSTMLYVYFSSVGIPGCGIFTWLMGAVGDKYGLRLSFLVAPIAMFLYGMLLLLERCVTRRK